MLVVTFVAHTVLCSSNKSYERWVWFFPLTGREAEAQGRNDHWQCNSVSLWRSPTFCLQADIAGRRRRRAEAWGTEVWDEEAVRRILHLITLDSKWP